MDVMDGDLKMMVKYLFSAIGREWTAWIAGRDVLNLQYGFRYKYASLDIEVRLRYAYQVVLLVKEAHGEKVLGYWMTKKNCDLNWETPVDVLRYGRNKKLSEVVEAAQKFVVSR